MPNSNIASGQPEISYGFDSQRTVNPQLSFSSDVKKIDLAWNTCCVIYLGADDPPCVLANVSNLGPVTVQKPKPTSVMVHSHTP